MLELKIGEANHGWDWLQWSASIVGSLAWPLAAVAIALIFRNQISALLAKIRTLTWGDKVADFSGKLDEIENVAGTAPDLGEQAAPAAPPPHDERFQQLLSISPSAAILESWMPIERKLKELSRSFIVSRGSHMRFPTTRETIDRLYLAEQISESIHGILGDLLALRNTAAHQADVSVSDALRFESLAALAIRELEPL